MPKTTTNSRPSQPANKPLATGSVLDRLGDWDLLQHDRGLKINIYGRSGSGKSSFCATAPKPILYAICSGGNKPGEMLSIDTVKNREGIDPVILNNSSELTQLVQHQERTDKYKTFVLDHASGFQDLVMREVCSLQNIPVQLGWGTATQQQWGQISLQCKERFRALLSLNCHVIIVAQEREYKPEGTDDLILPNVCAAITPSLAGWLNAAVDYIVNTFIREKYEEKKSEIQGKTITTRTRVKGKVEYCLRCGAHSIYTTKFRIPKGSIDLPEVIVDPSFDKILHLINSARG